jgi:cytochrome c556
MSTAPPRRTASASAFVLALACAALGAACVPKRDLPPNEIEKLGSLEHVMDVQATIADPQFKKIGESSYTDQDWTAFADVGNRLQVTSRKAKEFSKGPEFDAFADRLGSKAKDLEAAAAAKDARAASGALAQIKATCKECHSKFK